MSDLITRLKRAVEERLQAKDYENDFEPSPLIELTDALIDCAEALVNLTCACCLQKQGVGTDSVMPFFGGTEIALCNRCKTLAKLDKLVGE